MAGKRTHAEYISPIRYTDKRRDIIIAFAEIGRENSRSLSLAAYRLEYVLNTLPKTPSVTEITPINI